MKNDKTIFKGNSTVKFDLTLRLISVSCLNGGKFENNTVLQLLISSNATHLDSNSVKILPS